MGAHEQRQHLEPHIAPGAAKVVQAEGGRRELSHEGLENESESIRYA